MATANRILLVDDEADIREVLEISLLDIGCEVFSAENGEHALNLFRAENPPIVFTDIKMPGMDGIELLKKIKHENPETEVIMITGHGDMDLAVKSLKNDATDFITKPINVDALEIALKRARDKITTRTKLREYMENLESLVREKSELQDHLSTLGLMISTVSHGIKGLLTGLDGGMYLIESGLAKDDHACVQEGCEDVKRMMGRIKKMVLDILYYAKERELEPVRVDVLSLADAVVADVEPKLEGKNINLVREFDPQAGDAEIDPARVQSALLNILENAVDACEKDRTKASHQIVFGVNADRKNIIFHVEDDGVGMSKEIKEHIFKRFYSSKGDQGTGLGLFIAENIIRRHGGSIHVKSAPGRGSHFAVRIPKILNAG